MFQQSEPQSESRPSRISKLPLKTGSLPGDPSPEKLYQRGETIPVAAARGKRADDVGRQYIQVAQLAHAAGQVPGIMCKLAERVAVDGRPKGV